LIAGGRPIELLLDGRFPAWRAWRRWANASLTVLGIDLGGGLL
jgi:hypothetical protein